MSSALIRVEAVRACARYGSRYADAARAALQAIALLPLDEQVLDHASVLQSLDLRSLDAIHLASALSVAADLGVVLSYDERLCRAARESGLRVESPR